MCRWWCRSFHARVPRHGGVVSARIQQTSYAIPARTWHEAREWLLGAAVVSAGGGLVWLRCLWAVAGPGCGARGRWRGLAGLRDDAPSGRAAAHGHIEQPGPRGEAAWRLGNRGWQGMLDAGGPQATLDAAGRQATSVRNLAASRPTARWATNAGHRSPVFPQCRRRSAPRAPPGRTR